MFTSFRRRELAAKLFVFALIAAAVVFGVIPVALGQSYRGSLRGMVRDGSGAAVPSAKVILRGAEFAFERETASDSRGAFRMDDIPPGNYLLIVETPGFANATLDVRVAISSVREVTVTLK